MSVVATAILGLTTVENPEQGVDDATASTVTHDAYSSSQTLTSSSTPAVTACNAFEKALSSGTGIIDLTALPSTGQAVSGLTPGVFDRSGLRVQAIKVVAPAENSGPLTLTYGAATPYLLFGSGWKIILNPGEEFEWKGYGVAPVISSSYKHIDLSGTGTDVLKVLLLFGT